MEKRKKKIIIGQGVGVKQTGKGREEVGQKKKRV